MNKKNKHNSSVYQALLCLQAQGVDLSSVVFTEEQLMDADRDFGRHQYPENALDWQKQYNLKSSRAIFAIKTLTEMKILLLFIYTMATSNRVSVSIETLADIVSADERTVKRAINSLCEGGYIQRCTLSKKGQPTVYLVNPQLAKVGKGVPWSVYDDETDAAYKYHDTNNHTLMTVKVKHTSGSENSPCVNTLEYDSKIDYDYNMLERKCHNAQTEQERKEALKSLKMLCKRIGIPVPHIDNL